MLRFLGPSSVSADVTVYASNAVDMLNNPVFYSSTDYWYCNIFRVSFWIRILTHIKCMSWGLRYIVNYMMHYQYILLQHC